MLRTNIRARRNGRTQKKTPKPVPTSTSEEQHFSTLRDCIEREEMEKAEKVTEESKQVTEHVEDSRKKAEPENTKMNKERNSESFFRFLLLLYFTTKGGETNQDTPQNYGKNEKMHQNQKTKKAPHQCVPRLSNMSRKRQSQQLRRSEKPRKMPQKK